MPEDYDNKFAQVRLLSKRLLKSKGVQFIYSGYGRFLEAQQVKISRDIDGLPLLALLGLICGVLAGGVIIIFHLFIW